MNPSSVSYTVERVRKAAADPLFVKQGGSIAPTDHCHDLMQAVERILAEAENIRGEQQFDPASATGDISIMTSRYESEITLPPVIRAMRAQAPSVRLLLNFDFGWSVRDALVNGEVDLYLGPQQISDSGIFANQYLTRDYHLCMLDPSHPLAAKKKLTLDDIKELDHVHFEPKPGWQQAHFRYASSQGVSLRKAVISTTAQSFAEIIDGTDLVAALPSRVAIRNQDRVALVPFDFDTSMAEHMYWAAATDRSSLSRWVRSLIVREAKALPPVPRL